MSENINERKDRSPQRRNRQDRGSVQPIEEKKEYPQWVRVTGLVSGSFVGLWLLTSIGGALLDSSPKPIGEAKVVETVPTVIEQPVTEEQDSISDIQLEALRVYKDLSEQVSSFSTTTDKLMADVSASDVSKWKEAALKQNDPTGFLWRSFETNRVHIAAYSIVLVNIDDPNDIIRFYDKNNIMMVDQNDQRLATAMGYMSAGSYENAIVVSPKTLPNGQTLTTSYRIEFSADVTDANVRARLNQLSMATESITRAMQDLNNPTSSIRSLDLSEYLQDLDRMSNVLYGESVRTY